MSTAPTPASRLPEAFRAFRHPPFRLFFTGQLISLIGTWMQSVAQGWLMHRLTGSAFMLGILTFAQFAPALPLALWAGVIADRSDRRHMLLWTQILFFVQATVLATVVSAGVVQPWMVIVLACVYGVINTFDLPARQSFIIDMTGREDLTNGIALNSAVFNAARILGPAAAGILVATAGEAGCFWVNALSYIAVIASLVAMRGRFAPLRVVHGPNTRAAGTMREGLTYAFATRSIRQLLILLAVCAGLGFQFSVLLPVYARDIMHSGADAYGMLFSAFGVGSLIAAFRMAVTRERWTLRRNLLLGLMLGGIGLTGFAWARWFPAMVAFAAIAGFGLILYVSSTNTLIQLTVDDRYRGRVMSLYTLFFIGPSPLGALLAGGLAQKWGAPIATTFCALVLFGGALWVSVRLREIAAREAAAKLAAENEPVPEPDPTT